MNQNERREYLIKYLLKEEIRFGRQSIPADKQGQENLLRSLMNVRPPRPISHEFLEIQDEYLTERNIERGITDVATLTPVKSDSRLYIWQGDITTLKCDAIVNACNSQMLGCFSPMHACIDNFIHTYAGVELRLKMHEIMTKQGHEEETGKAKITSGYNLPAKYVLHAVGPIIQWKVTQEDENLLASCYKECLKLAADTGVESIAFCCLSTGVFRFPQQRAAEIATETVMQFLKKDDRIMVFVLFCTKKNGWGFENFRKEVNTGVGFALPGWIRGYMSYVLPLIIILVYLKGYYDMFSSREPAVFLFWMLVAVAFLLLVISFSLRAGKRAGQKKQA